MLNVGRVLVLNKPPTLYGDPGAFAGYPSFPPMLPRGPRDVAAQVETESKT